MDSTVREPAVMKRLRWTVRDYLRLSKAGSFGDKRVELLDGEIIEMAAQATPHRVSVTKIANLLLQAFPPPGQWVVVQGTLALPKRSAPDPDFHVFDAPVGTPDEQLPLPFLVIEISDTTYRKDSGPKLRAYAAGGVSDYWIVNIRQRRIEVYRAPENTTGKKSGWRYAQVELLSYGKQVSPLARPDLSFAIDDFLP